MCGAAAVHAASPEEAVAEAVAAAEAGGKELAALVKSLAESQPAGSLVAACKTLDQVRRSERRTPFSAKREATARSAAHDMRVRMLGRRSDRLSPAG